VSGSLKKQLCQDLRGEGLWPLVAQGHLTELDISGTKLTNLKILYIEFCPAVALLPKDGFLSSLQELEIISCWAIKYLPEDGLPSSILKLWVYGISMILKGSAKS